MRYRLIGVDLDGTLLNRRGQITHANIQAILAAKDQGVTVVPCTGRSWRESRSVVSKLNSPTQGVFVSGALVNNLQHGASLDQCAIDPLLALRIVESLAQGPDAVLVFRNAEHAGHDYLVTGQGKLSDNTRWWFDTFGAAVHFQEQTTPDDLQHVLRIGVVAPATRMTPLVEKLKTTIADQVSMHCFSAVPMPNRDRSINVLEVFAPAVDKWRGLQWIAQQQNITPDQIAFIGDEINDLTTMHQVGCAVAMGNAIDQIKEASDYVTEDCESDGVAHAIGQILSEDWG